MPIRYNPATGYHALYRKEDGGTEWVVNTDPDVVAQEIDRHRQEAEKRKNKKEKSRRGRSKREARRESAKRSKRATPRGQRGCEASDAKSK